MIKEFVDRQQKTNNGLTDDEHPRITKTHIEHMAQVSFKNRSVKGTFIAKKGDGPLIGHLAKLRAITILVKG